MFDIKDFQSSTTWDLENKIFYQYCNWCFANDQDNNGSDCEMCQQKFYTDIKHRDERL